MDPADPAAHPRLTDRPGACRRLGAGGFLRDVARVSSDRLVAALAPIAATPGVPFAVGVSKARLTRRPWWRAGLEMSIAGGVGTVVCRAIAKGIAAL